MSKSSGSKGRGRNRNNSGKRPQNRGGNFDPNSGRGRGNAQQLMDKYLALARDAASQGDRVSAENYYQHADHYYRVVYARNEQQEARRRAANNGNGRSDGEPIPVQSVEDGKEPVGIVISDTESDSLQAKPNVSTQAEAPLAEAAVSDPPKNRPRRSRPPRKVEGDASDSPAPEAAE